MGKKSKKEKKDKKHKKDRKEKKRRRDDSSSSSSSSSDSEDDRKRHKSEKLAQKVVAHLHKTGGAGEQFVWAKKVERELDQGKKLKEISIFTDRHRQQERLDELEKVRKRQAEREAEKAAREEELSMVQRMRAAQEAMESEAKEEEFYLKSLITKAERRLREGRPLPSDLIAKNLHLSDQFDFDMQDPWTHFEGLLLDDAQQLYDDIHEYQEFDKYEPLHVDFWRALGVIADHELVEARRRDEVDRAHLKGGAELAAQVAAATQETALKAGIDADIEAMLSGQTHAELCKLEEEVTATLASGQVIDTEYWEAVQRRLKIHKAKAHVRELMSKILSLHLNKMASGAAAAAAAEAGEEPGPSGRVAAGGIAQAMGWDREDRGVVHAPGVQGTADDDEQRQRQQQEEEAGPSSEGAEEEEEEAARRRERKAGARAAMPANDEEIPLDMSDEEGEGQRPERGTSEEGEEDEEMGVPGAAAAAAAAAGVLGPAPPQVVYPQEVPGWGRGKRYGRKRRGDADDAQRIGGEDEDGEFEVLEDGRLSPRPVDPRSIAGQDVINEEDDFKQLELLRQAVKMLEVQKYATATERLADAGPSTQDRSVRSLLRDSGRVGVHPMFRNIAADSTEGFRSGIAGGELSAEDQAILASFRNQSSKLMGDPSGDRDFTGEVPLEAQAYWWHDKYKPRKPKYFNRVHTGYDWNKYNQTHYDSDNPPPKVVQGYKFNILYHDLIDKKQTPTYVIERDPDSKDNTTCILRFRAGPPYEDIAFRIVAKEWEYSHKRGFRCTFERGILHLFFNFKRMRYRR